jgi:hypothetical protein
MAADWVLVALNWLIVGAILVPLRELFPGVSGHSGMRRENQFPW